MTIPPYDPQTPLQEDPISKGQPSFLTNFSTLFADFSVNHIALNDPTNPGNHSVIQLIEQSAKRTTQGQEIAIYSKKVENQTDQLFMRYPLNGKEFQLSQYQIYPLIATATQIGFFTYLPGGIIVYFGRVNPTSNEFPINLDPAVCNNIMGINLCPIGPINPNSYQSNVSLVKVGSVYTSVTLTSNPAIPLNQYYIVFGNI